MSINVAIPAAVPRTLIRTPQLNPVLEAMRAAVDGAVLTGTGPGTVAWLPALQNVNTVVTPGHLQGGWLINAPNSASNPALGSWGTRDAIVEIRDLNEAENDSVGLLVRYVEDQGAATTIRTGIHVNGWTRNDRGESSAIVAVQSGGGGTLVAYKSNAFRPPGKPDLSYLMGQALEVGNQDMGPGIFAASGSNFGISHTENAYAQLTAAVTAVQTTLPVGDLSKIPVPGSAGIYGGVSWPTPLHLLLENEYVSYTGTSSTSGPGNVTGVTRGINSTALGHPIATPVQTATANWAIVVAPARPISKGILITPPNGQFDYRPALTIGADAPGQVSSPGYRLSIQMNGDLLTYGVLATPRLVGQGPAPTAAAGAGAGTTPNVYVTGANIGGTLTVVTGSAPTAGAAIATVTFNPAYNSPPNGVLIAPANVAASGLALAARPWAEASETTAAHFVVRAGATALAAGTAYQFAYAVLG